MTNCSNVGGRLTVLSQIYQHSKGDFLRKLFTIALPITLQSILFASKGLVDVMMMGQLSETDIAAIGVSSRALFVVTILIGGVTTGGALLTAQYWGAGNKKGVRESVALAWATALVAALLIITTFTLFPEYIMMLASDSKQVIAQGSDYLMITSFSMLSLAYISSVAAGLRSVHEPMVSTVFSALGIVLNVLFNWILIFGHWGFPALGIQGAAIGTLTASIIEALALCIYLRFKAHLLSFKMSDVVSVMTKDRVRHFLSLSMPTTFNFLAWAGGLFAYTAIMGQTGEAGLVALSVMTPIESISLSLLVGIANASGVLVGNQLGAKRFDAVYYQAITLVVVAIVVTMTTSIVLYTFSVPILNLFTALEGETRALTETFFGILCVGNMLRSLPTVLVVGVLRAGGDVKFCLYQDMFTQWFFGIPLAAIGAIWLGFPPQWVFAMFFLEAVFKWGSCTYRLRSRKWMKNLIDA
ncbi:MATE family efflux transporter [Enterovibrio baiacu]|uniref:MATE family efflux transporter n=1 Tax=Enterovibrio baiacu TaxID=2491023 RepID=UPI001011B1A2|nr:MATE family efflux transporter [Enterovibrio baiacu]MBE1273574.1 MATE family efflux transporter [Enterovibrio baiacu]